MLPRHTNDARVETCHRRLSGSLAGRLLEPRIIARSDFIQVSWNSGYEWPMNQIDELKIRIRTFTQLRNWERFHSPKNLAMAITGEAGELAAEFQWLTTDDASDIQKLPINEIELEIADVAIYLIRLCDVLKIDLAEAIDKKLSINEERFPAVKSQP